MSSKNGKPNGQSFDLSQAELEQLLKKVPSGLHSYIDHLERQVKNLADIGLSLSKEKDMNVLLENILLEAKRITHADGGTLYMKTDDDRLRFEIMMTDSLNFHMGGTSGQDILFYPVKLYDDDGKPNKNMISAYVGLTGETVNIPDAYKADGFDFSGTKAFDKKTGYRSQSFLTVPLKNHEDEIIGVIQLLNAKDRKTGESIPFSTEVQDIVEALSSQAAVAITNKNLIRDLEILFESFIKLIASAIDAKSTYTGGHCSRVPVITMMLADAVNESDNEHYQDIHFTEKQMYELKIAAWLHDCGKVVTPEYVVNKATKLETIFDRVHMVANRFEVLKRDQEIKCLKQQLKVEKNTSLSELEVKSALKAIRKKYKEKIKQLDNDLDFVKTTNVGGEFMSGDKKDRVHKIAQYRWNDNGEIKNFLSDDEVKNLCIAKGTLTAEERKIINDHIVYTIDMLNQLPYPNHLKNIPEFAGGHHEKLDGTGYPMGLTIDEMSIQAKAMAIADVFEALTARDRPYKDGKALSVAMRIMGFMKNDAHVDPFLFELFVQEKIYLKYAEEYLTPEQLDMD